MGYLLPLCSFRFRKKSADKGWHQLSVPFCTTGLTYIKTNRSNLVQCTHTQTHLTALFPGLPGWAGTRKVKPIWLLLKQQTVSGSGISWAICKSAPCSRQITTPAPYHSIFYRPDALPATKPTASKHWRHILFNAVQNYRSIHHVDHWMIT